MRSSDQNLDCQCLSGCLWVSYIQHVSGGGAFPTTRWIRLEPLPSELNVAGLTPIGTQVESILDKDVYTLEELLDEDEIIQECKAVNTRLVGL